MTTTHRQPEKMALRPNEVVAACGISRTKVHLLIADGTLKTVKVGRARLILRTSLDALLTPAEAA